MAEFIELPAGCDWVKNPFSPITIAKQFANQSEVIDLHPG